jgi:hypothetical protein
VQTYDPIAVFMTGSIHAGIVPDAQAAGAHVMGRDVLHVDSKATKTTNGKVPRSNAQSPLSKPRNRPPVVRYPSMSSSNRDSFPRVTFLASYRGRGCSALTTLGGKPRFQRETRKKSRG